EENQNDFEKLLSEFFKDKIDEIRKDGFTKENLKRIFYANPCMIPEKPSLVSSAHRKLKTNLSNQGKETNFCKDFLQNISTELFEGATLFTVVKNEFKCEEYENVKLIRLKKDYDLNNWVQDQFIVLSSSNSIYMIEPLLLSNRKNNDYLEELNNVKFNGFSLKKNQVPFIFDGGNILIGDNFFFIGSDDFYKSQALFL